MCVEAQRLSRISIGADINPISVLASQAKTLPISEVEVSKILRAYFASFVQRRSRAYEIAAPESVQLKKWYSNSVANDLKVLFHIAMSSRDAAAQILKLFCFSALLMKVTRETRHWGYICDNTEPKDNPSRNVAAILEQTIEEVRLAFKERDQFVDIDAQSTPKILLARAEQLEDFVRTDSIDLVVTSPPYFGVVDYVKSQRLSMEWLGHDIEHFRLQETGARSKRHRRNATSEFENELTAAFGAVKAVLKPGRLCTVIFGASQARSFRPDALVPMLEAKGFEFVYEVNREISIQRRQKPSLLAETVFIFRKPLSNHVN